MAGAIDLGQTFDTIYGGMVQLMAEKSTALIQEGQDLSGVLLLISFTMILLHWMLTQDGVGAVVDGFGSVLRYSIVAMLLGFWVAGVGGYLQTASNEIAQKLTKQSSVSETVNMVLITSGRLLSDERLLPPCDPARPEQTACTDKPGEVKPGQTSLSLSWYDSIWYFIPILINSLLTLLALAAMALFLSVYMMVIFMAEATFGLGLAIGPILVPWLIWQRTEWMFDGWLRFMIAATLTKVVAAFLVALNMFLVMGLKTLGENINVQTAGDAVTVDGMVALLLLVVCLIGSFMMWQASSLAQSLISGGALAARGFGNGAIGRRLQNAGSGFGGGGGGSGGGGGGSKDGKSANEKRAGKSGGSGGGNPGSTNLESDPRPRAGQ